jgi:amidase
LPSSRPRARRRVALALAVSSLAAGAAAPVASAAEPIDLEQATVAELQSRMAAGTLTSVELTRLYSERVAALNTRGPGLQAVRMLNPKAIAEAQAADAARAAGKAGPLQGIPVLLKDNVDVAGIPTTAGSGALENSVPDEDSAIVTRLRAAGAVILGKTNLSVFANFFGASMPAGWSPLGGQVLNAYDADLSPSGSSSGSASAAAAGLAAVTIGTETSGSIISPAAAQGVVGLRPTVGLVSRTGILPISHTQDTAGPITRTVADAAAELQGIAGKDPEDDLTGDAPADVPDYLSGLDENALRGKRIGVVASNDANYTAARQAIVAAGAVAVEIPVSAPSIPSITTYEFKRDVNAYLARLPANAPRKTLGQILDYADDHAAEEKKFGAARAEEAQEIDLSDPTVNATYVAARDSGQQQARDYIDGLLDRGSPQASDDLDAVMTASGTLTGTGARAGYPQLTVPAGYTATQRRPVGVSFIGTAYSEKTLLTVGYGYEQQSKLRKPPSRINPAMYRCAKTSPPSVFGAHSCAPGAELLQLAGDAPDLPFSLETTSIPNLQARMRRGTLTATSLTKAYLARIARTNTEGPSINAVRIINPDALADAERLDAERAAGTVRGRMHGIPILVKDNIDVKGLPTTAGAVALENSRPLDDSPLVKNLRAAGAIILGKTNLSEFANFYSGNSVSGYSGLGGQVLTPTDLDVNPSGSSSGSGAAASAGLAAATIGTETSGSIISPSAANGIVGLRPTVGLVPRTGIIPISATQDTAGPMVQTVADAAAELQAMAGKDPEDPVTAEQPATLPDYSAGLTTDALRGKRIGVISSTDATYQAAIGRIQALGATTVTITAPAGTQAGSILNYEFKRDLNAYLSRLGPGAPIKSLAEVIAFNDAHPDEAIRLGQSTLVASQAIDLDDPTTRSTYEANRTNGQTQTRNNIDAALAQGTGTADDLAAIMTPSGSLTGTGARAGYPQLTVPAGYNPANNNPVNISFNGTRYTEATLLSLGYAFEQATQARRAPSATNPASWRCVPGSAFPAKSCNASEPLTVPETPAPGTPTETTPAGPTPTETTPTPGTPAPGTTTPTPGTPGSGGGSGSGSGGSTTPGAPVVSNNALRASTRRVVTVRIRCARTAKPTRCRGSVRIALGGRTIGSRTFSVRAGVTTGIRVTLTKAGYRTLVARRSLRTTVTVKATGVVGGTKSRTTRVTLRAPAR